MPPRPRPKPRPRATNSQSAGETETTTATNSGKHLSTATADDEDSFFIKRKITWGEIDRAQQRDREAEMKATTNDDELSCTSDGPDDAALGVDSLKSTYVSNIKPLPSWTKSLKEATSQKEVLIDIESSDSDDESLPNYIGTKAKGLNSTPRAPKRSRQKRSRSRSITPPPALSQTDVNAVTRQSSYQSSETPISIPIVSLDEDGDDAIFLDPELQMLKASIRQQSARAESAEPETHLSDSEDEDEDAENQVILLITWVHNPEDNAPIVIDREMEFPYPRLRNFQKLFETLSDILTIPSTNLTLLYENRRVYPGSSPDLLKMWEKAKLIVCEHGTIRHLQRAPKVQPQESNSDLGGKERSRSPSVHSEVDDNIEKMKIVIRSATVEIPFRVKTSRGFHKPALQLDGEKLDDNTILSELDIENGDILEVSNLS